MRFQILLFIAILSFLFIFAGCEKQPATDNAVENKTVNTNAVAANSSGLSTTKAPETATINAAPTIAPVVQSYYDALKKKDDAGLRKVFSQSTLKSIAADMKEEKKTSLTDFISELEPAPAQPFEVRNEKIEGDTGVAEIKGGSYAVWTPLKFVRENGEWKMTDESPDFDSLEKSTATNSAK